MNYEREKHEALRSDQPPIDPRLYWRYADVVNRMGVEWFERQVEEWEGDHPLDSRGKRQ